MIDREKVIKGLKCCTNKGYNHCSDCPYENLNGNGAECFKLYKDALELLTGQEPKQPEKIETEKMKICGLVSEIGVDGRFTNYPGGMTFSWRDGYTNERKEMTMLFEEWIQFSKEIVEAVARFEMEG